jgi:hypothetical protein
LSSYNVFTDTNAAAVIAAATATTATTAITRTNNDGNNNNKLFNVVYNIMKPITIGKMLQVFMNP